MHCGSVRYVSIPGRDEAKKLQKKTVRTKNLVEAAGVEPKSPPEKK
jgi:hypothetical protein